MAAGTQKRCDALDGGCREQVVDIAATLRSYAWAVTGKDGRFVIRGIRGERLVTLGMRGESIAFHEIAVVTRDMATITRQPTGFERWIDHLYGANFTCLVPPGRPISGTVRDAATGKPLAGVRMESLVFPGRGCSADGIIKC